MISDFICLTLIEDGESSKQFVLELPDIFNENEDRMVPCGNVFLKIEKDGFWGVHITLDESFVILSEGESYDRKLLIEAVMIYLNIQTNISFELSDVYLKDHIGKYKHSLYE